MEPKRVRGLILGIVLTAAGFYLAASVLSHDRHEGPFADYPPNSTTANICGTTGAYVSSCALVLLGWTSLPVAALIVVAGAYVLLGRKPPGLAGKATGAAVGLLALTIALGLPHLSASGAGGGSWSLGGASSGVIGMLLTRWLYGQVGWAGTLTVLVVLGAVCALLLVPQYVVELARAARAAVRRRARRPPVGPAVPEGTVTPIPLATRTPREEPAAASSEPVRVQTVSTATPAALAAAEKEPVGQEQLAPSTEPPVISRAAEPAADRERPPRPSGRPAPERAAAWGEFRLPPLELLEPVDDRVPEADERDIRQKGELIERTLRDFNIEAKVVRVQRGPVITMYEMSLAAGTKVSRVESLGAELAIALKAPNVRTVAPIPGKNTIGIEVPNTQREIVKLRELLESTQSRAAGMAIPLFLGKDTAGNPLVVDLAMAPHLLLAGTTGSGKSVAVNSIICSILMTRTPQEVQLLLVDPKGVEFSDYPRLPHLICPILTDIKKAASVLQWACKKMDERYALLARVGARDLSSYNRLGEAEIVRRLNPEEDAEIDDVPFYMRHTVIVVDELGELMLVAAKEVESSVIRLSQKARAVGIHLICATQRPSVDVITGLIKANLPARVAFHVSAKVDSRTILDRNGAELLLGRGDMLMLPPGSSRLVRAQGTYVSPAEVQRIVEFLVSQGEPQFQSELREYSAGAGAASEADDLYDEAVRIVLETQRGSVSLLQRRLSIGYSRAARLIDMMAEEGIVGAYKGSQAREVVLTLDEWEQSRQKAT